MARPSLPALLTLGLLAASCSGDSKNPYDGVYNGPNGCTVVVTSGKVTRFALTMSLNGGSTQLSADVKGSWALTGNGFSLSTGVPQGTLAVSGSFQGDDASGAWEIAQAGNGLWTARRGGTPAQDSVATPTATVVEEGRSFTKLALASSTADAEIRYTLDGKSPLAEGKTYSAPLVVSRTLTLKAVASLAGRDSEVLSVDYAFTGADAPLTAPQYAKSLGTAEDDDAGRPWPLDSGFVLEYGGRLTRLRADGSVESVVEATPPLDPDGRCRQCRYFLKPAADGSFDLATFEWDEGKLALTRVDKSRKVVFGKQYDLARPDKLYNTEHRVDALLRLADQSTAFAFAHEGKVGLLTIDTAGSPVSFRLYGSGEESEAIESVLGVQRSGTGLVLVAEYRKTALADPRSYLLLALDAAGAISWARRLDTGLADNWNFHTHADWSEGNDGSARLALSQTNTPTDGGRVLVYRFDAAHACTGAWKHKGFAEPFAASTADGGLLIGGSLGLSDPPYGELTVARLDAGQKLLWSKSYGGLWRETFAGILPLASGGALVSGSTWSFGAGKRDTWLLRLDEAGSLAAENPALALGRSLQSEVVTLPTPALVTATPAAESRTVTVTNASAVTDANLTLKDLPAPLGSVQYP